MIRFAFDKLKRFRAGTVGKELADVHQLSMPRQGPWLVPPRSDFRLRGAWEYASFPIFLRSLFENLVERARRRSGGGGAPRRGRGGGPARATRAHPQATN